jgi:hypothetical protein
LSFVPESVEIDMVWHDEVLHPYSSISVQLDLFSNYPAFMQSFFFIFLTSNALKPAFVSQQDNTCSQVCCLLDDLASWM